MKASGSDVWASILEEKKIKRAISRTGYFEISSTTLNQISKPLGGPDARNLVKFDSSDQLPAPLKELNLAILPVSRGEFLVGQFDVYLETHAESLRKMPVRSFAEEKEFETLDTKNLNSESKALMAAYSTGIISDFLGGETRHTGFGKTSSEEFNFKASITRGEQIQIHVDSSTPMEIDGTYETKTTIGLIEAKNLISRDFHVRQLYYPFRSLLLRHSKSLAPILMTQSAGIFEFRLVNFRDPQDISSFEITKTARYSIGSDALTESELLDYCREVPASRHGGRETFPQADRFEKVMHVINSLVNGPMNKTQIADLFGYTPRQGDYYAKAGAYMGLIEKDGLLFKLSPLGNSIAKLTGTTQIREVSKLMLRIPTIREIFLESLRSKKKIAREKAIEIMRSHRESAGINPTTELRRVNTAVDWVDWIHSNFST